MEDRKCAIVLLITASFVWAGVGISWKYFILLGIAFMTVFMVSRLFKFLSVLFIAYYRVKQHEPIKNAGELFTIFLNACFSVGTPLFFVLALGNTTISNAYFLMYTMPAWVLIASVLILGETMSPKKLGGILLTLTGITLIAAPWNSGFQINLGLVYGLLAAFSHTGDIITSRELKDYAYHTVSLYSNFMQLVVAAIVTPLFFEITFNGLEPVPLLAMAAIGILLGIASDMYYHALDILEASTAAIVSFSELIFAGILAFIFFSELPKESELIGYVLIFLAGAVLVLRTADIERFEHLLRFTDRM